MFSVDNIKLIYEFNVPPLTKYVRYRFDQQIHTLLVNHPPDEEDDRRKWMDSITLLGPPRIDTQF